MTGIRNDAQAVHTHKTVKNCKHENYRTTSILPALVLKFERVLHNKIKGFIQRKMCKKQHGFRKTTFNCEKTYIVL